MKIFFFFEKSGHFANLVKFVETVELVEKRGYSRSFLELFGNVRTFECVEKQRRAFGKLGNAFCKDTGRWESILVIDESEAASEKF